MMPWFDSAVATGMIVFSGIGAMTVGVFVGMTLGRKESRKKIADQDAYICEQDKLLNQYRVNAELQDCRYNQMKGLLNDLKVDVPKAYLKPESGEIH